MLFLVLSQYLKSYRIPDIKIYRQNEPIKLYRSSPKPLSMYKFNITI